MSSTHWIGAAAAFLLSAASLGHPSRADVVNGVVARTYYFGAVGRFSNRAARDPQAWLKQELEDWQDPKTATTLTTGHQCGLSLKFRLFGTPRHNYLGIEAVRDQDDQSVLFDPSRITMRFANGPSLPATAVREGEPVDLQSGDALYAAIPFADKGDFLGISEIHATIPFGDCVAEASFRRPIGQLENLASSLIWSRMQLGLEIGSGIYKSGDLAVASGNGVEFNLTVMRYPWVNHGFWAGFQFQDLGSQRSLTSGIAALVGYSYRRYISARWAFHYDIAPGVYEFAHSSVGQGAQRLDHAFVLGQRVGIDWIFGRLNMPDFLESDHGVGLVVADDWLPSAQAAGSGAAGNALSLLVRYIFAL